MYIGPRVEGTKETITLVAPAMCGHTVLAVTNEELETLVRDLETRDPALGLYRKDDTGIRPIAAGEARPGDAILALFRLPGGC